MNTTFFKYLVFSSIFILLTEITNNVLDFKGLLYNSLSEELTSKELKNYFDFQDKWHLVSLIFIPIIILIKSNLIASVLYIGVFFSGTMFLNFRQLWDMVVKAEFVFLPSGIIKIVWFYFFQTNYKLEDVQYFSPLSALSVINYKDIEPWFIYPFQTISLFELAYWLILAYYIGKATETNMDKGLKIVAYSYGPALLLWVVTIMFFTLNYSM